MRYEIRSWHTNAVLFEMESTSLAAVVIEAVHKNINLSGADLSRANLSRANLSGAKGIQAEFFTPLMMLLDQPGKMRAYKLVTMDGKGPWNGGQYEIGKRYAAKDADTDKNKQCAPGLNVATLDWVLREWKEGYRVLVVEFTAKDIACIPIGTDGKFRLHRMKVVGKKDVSHLVGTGKDKTP